MRYGSTTLATSFREPSWRIKLIKAVLFFIPSANPDHEKFSPSVRKWILEINENGNTTREIALDEKGRVLFGAPDNGNLGFWTESDLKFTESELANVTKNEFDKLWDIRNEN